MNILVFEISEGTGEKDVMENFFIEPTGELDVMDEHEKQEVSDHLVNFLQRHRNRFNEAHLRIQFKQHKEKFREKPSMYCRINLTTDRGNFQSSEHGWGSTHAVSNALDDLETQIDKKFGKMVSRVSIRDKSVEEVME